MESRFLAAVDAAVEQILPLGWPRVPAAKLPTRGALHARHAFRLHQGDGPSSYLVVLAAPPYAERSAEIRHDLALLVEHVLARGAHLLLLHEAPEDHDFWIGDELSCPHPRFLTLSCAWNGIDGYDVEPTAEGAQDLASALFELWCGTLFYVGPPDGRQTIGVEIMRDHCWRCTAALGTITGIVFPDRAVLDWSSPDWLYFHQLLELANLPESLVPDLAAAVDAWRAEGQSILTPIRWHFSRTAHLAYWAAECPVCHSFRGAFPVLESRLGLLHDLASRTQGDLAYRPLTLDLPLAALRALTQGFEINPHTRPLGWFRAASPSRLTLPSPPFPRNDTGTVPRHTGAGPLPLGDLTSTDSRPTSTAAQPNRNLTATGSRTTPTSSVPLRDFNSTDPRPTPTSFLRDLSRTDSQPAPTSALPNRNLPDPRPESTVPQSLRNLTATLRFLGPDPVTSTTVPSSDLAEPPLGPPAAELGPPTAELFPGADGVARFWEKLAAGAEAITFSNQPSLATPIPPASAPVPLAHAPTPLALTPTSPAQAPTPAGTAPAIAIPRLAPAPGKTPKPPSTAAARKLAGAFSPLAAAPANSLPPSDLAAIDEPPTLLSEPADASPPSHLAAAGAVTQPGLQPAVHQEPVPHPGLHRLSEIWQRLLRRGPRH